MTFDLQEFYFTCSQINLRLGYLRANECVQEWWKSAQEEWQSQPGLQFRSMANIYNSTTQDPAYDVEFHYSYVPTAASDDETGRIMSMINLEADQAWNNGQTWAAGISSYLEDMCAPFTEPDHATLQSTIGDFKAAQQRMESAVPANWNELDVSNWIGDAHDEFVAFVKQLYDSMEQYDRALTHAENWFTAVAALVSQTQEGVMPFLKKVNDELDSQLQQWALNYGSPGSFGGGPSPLVANIVKLGDNLLSYVPLYSTAKDDIAKVKESTEDALAVFNRGLPAIDLDAGFTLRSATEIYQGLADTLSDKHLKPFNDTLANMGTRSASLLTEIDHQGSRWYPPKIPNARNMTWEPSFSAS